MPDLTVRITRAFEGPRHERLHALWDTVAEFWSDHLRLAVTKNPGGLGHAAMFNRMWYEELQRDSRYVLLTEHDFLPALEAPWWYSRPGDAFSHLDDLHGQEYAAICCEYATRNPATKALQHRGMPGGWWVLIDKERFNDRIDFHGTPDPCNQLEEAVGGLYMVEGVDSYPQHYGIKYPFGTHLFWSRHYNDPPTTRVSGFSLGDIQLRHDAAVESYIREAPDGFRKILKERHASLL